MQYKKVWDVKAPWGIIECTAYGNPNGQPVLLVHGRQDCAATFEPLLEQMALNNYHYVALNMPGSGRSTPFPVGIKIMRFHFMASVEVVIEHLKWDKFIYIGHSMGCELALFYNAIYPNRITRLVLLDGEPGLRRIQIRDPAEYQTMFYDDYYNNYQKENFSYRTYTKPQAIKALMRARELTEDKAKLIVDHSLIHVSGDQYRFTWGGRLKLPAAQNYPNTYYFSLFCTIPPTILISATQTVNANSKYRKDSLELIEMLKTLKNFKEVFVEGNHDVHLSCPERVAPVVVQFLKEGEVKSKL